MAELHADAGPRLRTSAEFWMDKENWDVGDSSTLIASGGPDEHDGDENTSLFTSAPSSSGEQDFTNSAKSMAQSSMGLLDGGTHQSPELSSRFQEQERERVPRHRSFGPATTLNTANGNAAANGVRLWGLILIFSLVQMFFSPTLPFSGVNASTSSPDQVADTGSGNGGSGNSANQGGANYNRQYFRQLPPITDTNSAAGTIVAERMTESRRLLLRQEAKDMFLHGYNGYLNHAFPKDELNPVACQGRGSDKADPDNMNVNDVLGDFSLTLIDALDTLATIREPELFRQAIKMVQEHVRDFNINSRVQVFEVNIRVLGALLSAHQYASDPSYKSLVKGYQGELLKMAEDLGQRLMKVFEHTPTGIPWPRVNLQKGLLNNESAETCAAGAGSLLLEFGVLSRLTGDMSYEAAAKRALFELWSRRSNIGLMGNTIDIRSGQWMSVMTGIGAGTDSFYEYLLKSYVLFGDDEYLEMYETAQDAIRRNLQHDSKYFYKHVHLEDATQLDNLVDSLSAFMPGVQVLGGDLESAIKNHLYYYNIWRKYQAIPERFDFVAQSVSIANYPLRPEFIESNYFLYRATKDPFYLQVGEMVLRDLQKYARTKCGWASIKSVVDKKHEDRMESFALSETFKYLYLLFDEENLLHNELKDTNFVFTTEGHILSLPPKHLDPYRKSKTRHEVDTNSTAATGSSHEEPVHRYNQLRVHRGFVRPSPVCKAYRAPETFLKSIPYRSDADFARQMVGTREDVRDLLEVDPKGFCEKPTLDVEHVIVEFFGPPKKTIFEDENVEEDGKAAQEAGKSNESDVNKKLTVIPIKNGVFVNRIVGVKILIQYDGLQNGYRAIKVADYPLSLDSNVYVEQSSMRPLWDSYQRAQDAHLRIFRTNPSRYVGGVIEKNLLIMPADFGYWRPRIMNYSLSNAQETSLADHLEEAGSPHLQQPLMAPASAPTKPLTTKYLVRIEENTNGCRPFTIAQSSRIKDRMLVVDGGGCLFILKAFYAQAAGAHSIVVINQDDNTFPMTGADPNENASSSSIGEGIKDDDINIHAVMIKSSEGQLLLDWIKEDESSPSASGQERVPGLVAGFVQRKITKDEMANARLSYNNLPIINISPSRYPPGHCEGK